VAFATYDPPFARFGPKGDLQASVILISQPGTQDRLFGLYEIMQTLEIVPTEGPRERRNDSFTIEGIGGGVHSYTQVGLENGEIKGFTLVWPQGDEERRSRVLDIMRSSFARIDGVLDPALARPGEEQAVDLISGLAIRQPIRSRSGFYIDSRGHALTVAEAVEGCAEITIDGSHEARVAHLDADLGIAVLEPLGPLAPISIASFQTGVPRLQSEISVAGFPFGAILAAPALTFGTLADIRGLNGEDEVKRLDISVREGDAGGPVFDNGGNVLGMLLPPSSSGTTVLPNGVSFSVDSEAILASLGAAGISVTTTDALASITPELLTRRASEVTVLVSCWD
jgi:S1-C subfamily serine protease